MDLEPQNDFDREIETLKSMFGELVSTAVIVAVLESCNGDVNLAAEGIMSIVSDGPLDAIEMEDNATGAFCPVDDSGSCQVSTSDNAAILDSPEQTECPPNTDNSLKTGHEINNELPIQISTSIQTDNPAPVSYADAFRSTGAVPKVRVNTVIDPRHCNNNSWNDQLRRILTYHNQGSRTMIIMRGVPGSGKSTLAQYIINMTIGSTYENYGTHIYSSDDYFFVRGKYLYDRNYLHEAHQTNQTKVFNATNQGISPVIIDNTNVKIWEMEPYVRDAVRNGYYIEIVEPNTPWGRNANQLSRRNKHNVPKEKIRKMLDDYDKNVTVANLLKCFRLRYPINKTPPIKRNIPPPPEISMSANNSNNKVALPQCFDFEPPPEQSNQDVVDASTSTVHNLTAQMTTNGVESEMCINPIEKETMGSEITKQIDLDSEESKRLDVILQAQKKLEEIENLEKEWENGQSWVTETTQAEINNASDAPKPPRNIQNLDEDSKIIELSTICDDWSKISLFMAPWQDNNGSSIANQNTIHAETSTKSTCIEIGDVNNAIGLFKVVECSPRNINDEKCHDDKKEKIPDQRMLDKSTSTHEQALAITYKCKNEEKHFIAFRKMFKNVPRPVLRDIFEKCLGDVNWAVNIVLDGKGDNEMLAVRSEELSDTEEDTIDQCECLAAYSIIPDIKRSSQEVTASAEVNQSNSVPNSPIHGLQKKPKRERKMSENDKILELKRQIENNVIISDHHYSPHYLSLRRGRRDNLVPEQFKSSPTNSNNSEENLASRSSTSNLNERTEFPLLTNDGISQDPVLNEQIKDNEIANMHGVPENALDLENDSSTAEPENVTINLGIDFTTKLDELFGRKGIIYPENVKPIVNVPMSLLKEFNALWAESIAYQMDAASMQTQEMIQKDETFARDIIAKEEELARNGKESKVPDFKEIMDMDYALSIYEKDVAGWRNNEPQDMAAKMSRDKLYNLFPDVSRDVLDEMLMAHDNHFKSTVESTLMSTGQGNLLEDSNGVNKFIMEMEFKRKEKLLEEERKKLSEEQWPYLSRADTVVTMDEVNNYREVAQHHLDKKNACISKAIYHSNRNEYSTASFYNELAAYNFRRYKLASDRAASSLIHYHAANCKENGLLDLHYMRVAEAKETLDMFIDNQIQKLRDIKNTSGQDPESINLYFITGRGAHSQGLPRIKPAVIKRLNERDLIPSECNPGLISTKISMYTKMTHELNRVR